MICAVVPIKAFGSAKTRLGSRLDPEQRACLARASAIRVLRTVSETPALERRIAVVEDEEGAALARNHRFEVLLRPGLTSQSAAVDAGFTEARAQGATTLLTVSADVPLARPSDLEELLRPGAPVLVMVSNLEGEGTNAMRVSPALDLRLHFGPGSLAQHTREAEGLGVPVRVLDNPRLRLDVDTADDLDALEKSGPEGRRVLIEAGQLRRDLVIEEEWAAHSRQA